MDHVHCCKVPLMRGDTSSTKKGTSRRRLRWLNRARPLSHTEYANESAAVLQQRSSLRKQGKRYLANSLIVIGSVTHTGVY